MPVAETTRADSIGLGLGRDDVYPSGHSSDDDLLDGLLSNRSRAI